MAKKSLAILILTLTAFTLISFLSGCEGALEELQSQNLRLKASASRSSRPAKSPDNKHLHYVSPDTPLKEIIKEKGLDKADDFYMHVDLSNRTLYFMHSDEILKRYRIGAGQRTLLGDKQREGDMRTPRGEFYICSKVVISPSSKDLGTRWMQLSYPNAEAAERGLKNNVISKSTYDGIIKAIEDKTTPPQTTPLGSAIGMHGAGKPSNPRNWTAGCIGMYNEDIEEIFDYVKIGTRISIKWGALE